jgi:hypothetical protein
MGGQYYPPGSEDHEDHTVIGAYSNNGTLLWQDGMTIIDLSRNNSIDDFIELEGQLVFFFKNAYSLDTKTGKIEPYQSKINYYLNSAKLNKTHHQIAALEIDKSPAMLFYDQSLNLVKVKKTIPPNTFRILGKAVESTADGGYVFLFRWEIDEFGPYPNKNVIRIVKTDCQGNEDVWKDCTLSDDEVSASKNHQFQVVNPFSDKLLITWHKTGGFSIALFDLHGRMLLSDKVTNSSQLTLNTSTLNNGIYLLRSKNIRTGQIENRHIIKQ